MPDLTVGFLSYVVAAAAYLSLALYYLWRGRWGRFGHIFLAAAGLTLVWALFALAGHGVIPRYPKWTLFIQQISMFTWVWFLWNLIASIEQYRSKFPRRIRLGWVLFIGLGLATLATHAVSLVPEPFALERAVLGFTSVHLPLILGLTTALVGLSLTETLYRGYRPQERWGVKFLCLGTGALFAYDVFLFGEGLLFRALDPAFAEMRGFVQALATPLFMINIRRSEARHFGLGLSQRMVFGSTVVLAAGLYLAVMAIAAFYVRTIGGTWGSAVQYVFLFAALLLLVVFLLSGAFRASLRMFLSHHVLKDRYDYRQEWLRLSERLVSADSGESFERRVIRALADIVDSPAGALWRVGENHLPIAAAWNLSPTSLTGIDTREISEYISRQHQVYDLTQDSGSEAQAPAAYRMILSELRRIPNAWVLIALLHQGRPVALLLLTRPRSPRDLEPEDSELLGVAARQAAGLFAERGLARDLAESRQFERFNQRYAFVAHDLKNLVSQLSLLIRNHERFGERPEFRKDMIETIKSAVTRMELVMTRLREPNATSEMDSDVDARQSNGDESAQALLGNFLRELVGLYRDRVADLNLTLTADAEKSDIRLERARIETMLRHLLENAVEAAGEDGQVTVSSRSQGNQIIIEVLDNGPGMDARFIETQLFKPFHSTKDGGFGIGAYQCRALARELGGELEAVSVPGAGTTMRLSLPHDDRSKEICAEDVSDQSKP